MPFYYHLFYFTCWSLCVTTIRVSQLQDNLFCPNNCTETFKSPQDEVLQIQKDKWREIHLGITSYNASRDLEVRLNYNNICISPELVSANSPFFEFHVGDYCPEHAERRNDTTCRQLILFVKGAIILNQTLISLCVFEGLVDVTHELEDQQILNYTINVVSKL